MIYNWRKIYNACTVEGLAAIMSFSPQISYEVWIELPESQSGSIILMLLLFHCNLLRVAPDL